MNAYNKYKKVPSNFEDDRLANALFTSWTVAHQEGSMIGWLRVMERVDGMQLALNYCGNLENDDEPQANLQFLKEICWWRALNCNLQSVADEADRLARERAAS